MTILQAFYAVAPFLIFWSIGIVGVAYYVGKYHGFELGRARGRIDEAKRWPGERITAKAQGYAEGRAAAVAEFADGARFNLTPLPTEPRRQIMGCKHCGPVIAYGSKCTSPLAEMPGFHTGAFFYADTGEPVPETAWSGYPSDGLSATCGPEASRDAAYGGGVKVEACDEMELPTDAVPQADAMLRALDGFQDSVRTNFKPGQP
jgi:hypothetical protein